MPCLLAAIGSPRFDALPREKRPETGLLGLRAGMGFSPTCDR